MSVTPGDYEFVGSKNSYYSAKVRACLQYKRLPYSEVCANGDTLRRAKAHTGNHFYPVVICPDGTVLQDSCDIVEALEARHPARPVIPEDPILRLLATLIETLADDFMIRTSIAFRWVHPETADWSLRLFRQICSERMSEPEARAKSLGQAIRIGRSIQSRVKSMPPQIYALSERVTREICDRLDAHLTETPFLLGDRPSLADLGMMNAMFPHLYRDPGPISDHMRWECISLSLWIDHMLAAAGESDQGALYLSETLLDLLETLGSAYADMARLTLDAADLALPSLAVGEAPPPFLGPIEAQVMGEPMPTQASAYAAWKLQRLIDTYRAVPYERRAMANALLQRAGFREICEREPGWRLEKHHLSLTRAA